MLETPTNDTPGSIFMLSQHKTPTTVGSVGHCRHGPNAPSAPLSARNFRFGEWPYAHPATEYTTSTTSASPTTRAPSSIVRGRLNYERRVMPLIVDLWWQGPGGSVAGEDRCPTTFFLWAHESQPCSDEPMIGFVVKPAILFTLDVHGRIVTHLNWAAAP